MKVYLLTVVLVVVFCLVSKQDLLEIIDKSLPQKEAAMMAGILLGDKSGFEKTFYNDLKKSGLIHLVVVSGSNVMLLIGGLIELAASNLGRRKSIILGLMIGWWYVTLVGWEIPVLRAMLLLSIIYLAQLLGRKYTLWRGIILAVLIMVVGDVRVLLSVSFWLSITAYLAIVVVKTTEWQKAVWVSLWVTPILAMVFGKISLISPITNLMVIGVVEWLTVVGAIGLVFGKLIFWMCIPLLKYLELVVSWGGRWPQLEISFNWPMLIGYYLMLFVFVIKNKNKAVVN